MAVEAPQSPVVSTKCLTTNLGWLLDTANHAFGTEVAAALEPLGLGARGYCVLATAMQGHLTQGELAGIVGIDKTTMVVTVDELERAGLVQRNPSSTDRRARVISVTKAGERKVAEGQRIIDAVQDDVLSSLAPDERKVFLSALTKLVSERLAQPVECHPPLRRRELRV
jgi:DNA-binding MarR family transcriptional regulator